MTEERVLVHIEDHVAHVKLNRAEKRNGLDLPMFDALLATGVRLKTERGVRAVVLSGEGKAFCAGLDWMAFMANTEASARLLDRPADQLANVAQRICTVWQEVPVPVIAAVHGAAMGGGLQLALGADLRIVAPDAQLAVAEIRYGLIPDMGATQTLLRLVRPDVAAELLFTGRIVNGNEAVALGLATRVSETPLEDALGLARMFAKQSPDALRAGKQLILRSGFLNAKEALALETELQLGLLGSANQLEAVQATMTKRAPEFTDP